ncbi:MAG: DNA polymerase/3'-5' exonuclease PolX [Candidatus Woesearchaeota archaeon]
MPQHRLHSISNKDVARIFYEMADILEMQDVAFKPIAYRKAARSIESLSSPLSEFYENDTFENIPGVGEHLAKKIRELLETGRLQSYEKLKAQMPSGVSKLMNIPSMGPKKIKRLYDELKVRTITDLKKAISSHKISALKGFGQKSEQDIAEGLTLVKQGSERRLLAEAYPVAESVRLELSNLSFVKQVSLAGSVLRMKETIGDLDLLATSPSPEKVIAYFVKMPHVKKILAQGSTKASILTKENLQMDLRVVPQAQFGSALQYFTGSKEHGVAVRNIAISRGYKLSEYGLFDRKTDKLIESASEKRIYEKLGMKWIPPELRENTGEIEAAQHGKLPSLVELNDILGDFHVHSTYSEGENSILEMANAAKRLGRKYIVMTDHSQSSKIANGMEVKTLLKQINEIDKLNSKLSGFHILKSAEVDIKADGSLDYPDSVLLQLDLVVGSIHSGFKKDNTERLLKAMDNKYLSVIGHPTGRMIGMRNPYQLDFEQVFDKAADTGIALEINAQPLRMDLNDVLVKSGLGHKVKFTIGTDSHEASQLANMKYGVAMARRGWLESKDVLNTLPYQKVLKVLRR